MPPRKPKPKVRTRKDGTPRAVWTPPPPPPSATSIAERDALEALADVLAPRVLGALHDRVVDMVSYERARGIEALAEIGYVVNLNSDNEAADALIHILAREAVRAVKERFAATATGPTADAIKAESGREVAMRPQRLSTKLALEAAARERAGSKRSDRPNK
jgi:hypothetical protein